MNLKNISKGMSILEIVIGASILLIIVTAVSETWRSYMVITRIGSERTQSALLVEEASEILQFLRDKGWASNIASLSLNTPYYLTWYNNNYVATTSQVLIQDKYLRTITFSSISRDAQDNISSSGIVDLKTRKVTIAVTTIAASSTVNVIAEMLIHDVHNN